MALRSGQLRRLKLYRTKPASVNVLTVDGNPPPVGEIGTQYLADFNFSGGTAPYFPSLVGLGGASIDASGHVSGALTGSPGTRSPVLTVMDSTSPTALTAFYNWSVAVSASASGATVNAQTIYWADGTLANQGDCFPIANNTITSATIVSGNDLGYFTVNAATGLLTPTAAADTANFSGLPITLVMSFNGEANVNITMAREAVSGRSVKNAAELTAALAAWTSGTNIFLRPGVYSSSLTTITKAFAADSYLTKHTGQTELPKFSRFYLKSPCAHIYLSYLDINGLPTQTSRIMAIDGINVGVKNCKVHGQYYDPNGNYTTTAEYNNPTGFWLGLNTAPTNVTISGNEIYSTNKAIVNQAIGYTDILNNEFYWQGDDIISGGPRADSTRYKVVGNTWRDVIGKPADDDPGGPRHIDYWQIPGGTSGIGIECTHNIGFCGSARGFSHGIFFNPSTSGGLIDPLFAANFIECGAAEGFDIQKTNGGRFLGNVVVQQPGGPAISNPFFHIGVGTAPAPITCVGNIAGDLQITTNPGSTIESHHNIELGYYGDAIRVDGGAIIPGGLGVVFDGPTFAPTTRAGIMSTYSMKTGGPADLGAAGPSHFDIGCFDTGYATFPTTATDPAGTTLADTTGDYWR